MSDGFVILELSDQQKRLLNDPKALGAFRGDNIRNIQDEKFRRRMRRFLAAAFGDDIERDGK